MKKNQIDTQTLILIIFLLMALINALTSCAASKIDRYEGGWSPAPKKSNTTNWIYQVKK